MSLRDNIKGAFDAIRGIENVDVKQNERDVITTKITTQQLLREAEDIKKWRDALTSAESVISPNRTPIQRIYNEIILDPHLSSVINTRTNSILATSWKIYNQDGTVDEESTKIVDKSWFEEVRREINRALYYGYTLIQLGAIVDDEFTTVDSVVRANIVPEEKSVKKTQSIPSKEDLTSFELPPYDKWTIWVDTKDLGLLNNCSPYAIYKKNAASFWSRYLQLFGMPFRIGKTDISDPARRQNMANMLKNSSSAGWVSMDQKDEMEFVQSSGSIGNPVYLGNIDMSNSEMSKVILGNTMQTEDGSSKSQAEVHERVGDIYTMSDKIFEANVINKEVIPLLVTHGILSDGKYFQHEHIDNVSTDDKVKHIVDLTGVGYVFEPDFVEQYTGLEVAGVKSNDPVENASIINKMNNLYKNV